MYFILKITVFRCKILSDTDHRVHLYLFLQHILFHQNYHTTFTKHAKSKGINAFKYIIGTSSLYRNIQMNYNSNHIYLVFFQHTIRQMNIKQ